MTSDSPFASYRATPVYDDVSLYQVQGAAVRPWEFNGWKPESLSWKEGAYVHAGLSAGATFRYVGPDATNFLKSITVNSFERFPVGTAKHAIMTDANGLVAGHGVLKRDAEQDYTLFVGGFWASYQHSRAGFDVREETLDEFLFQIAGPTALQIVEAATGQDHHDLGFLRFRDTTVAGHRVEIMRVGMAGSLAYEMHGPKVIAAEVYDAVYRAGASFGIQRLGWRTYPVNHVEGGFPQTIWTFMSSAETDSGFQSHLERVTALPFAPSVISGSVDPADLRARQRTPFEVGWDRMVKFDHDFIGRQALESQVAAGSARRIVTLEWDSEDVIDIYASLFREGEDYKYLELPAAPHLRGRHAHADHVRKDGEPIGWSSGNVYSYYYRRVISHASIEPGFAEIGTEVTIDWGDFGMRIKPVRARVARYPYLDGPRNQDIDTSSVPRVTRVA